MTTEVKYPIHIILKDNLGRKFTKVMMKTPALEGTTFGWNIHGGEYSSDQYMFARLDVLGIEDRDENRGISWMCTVILDPRKYSVCTMSVGKSTKMKI